MRRALRPDRRLDACGLEDGDGDPPRSKLEAENVGERLERMLGGGVRAEEGRAATSIEPMRTTRPRLRRRAGRTPAPRRPGRRRSPRAGGGLVERDELERSRDRPRRSRRPSSTGPTIAAAAAICSASVTSSSTGSTSRARSASRLPRSERPVDAPGRRKRSARARPIPDEAPGETDFDELNRRGSSSGAPRGARTSQLSEPHSAEDAVRLVNWTSR